MKKMECPSCRWSSGIIYLSSRDSYQCTHCGHIWERGRKLVKERVYRCPHCGHQWDEKDILIAQHIKTE